MSDRRRQRLRTILTILVTVLVIAPAAALAGHQFTDVPDSNVFHDDIQWMRDNGVTAGCNPPANDMYCPGDNVTREQMAAFMHRLETENVFVRPGEDAVDGGNADTVDGMHAADFLGASDKAADSDELDGIDSADFATDAEVDAELDALDAFMPIAVFTIVNAEGGVINNVNFRAPITGPPTVSGSDGDFTIDLPGFSYTRFNDTAVCTTTIRGHEVAVNGSGGDLTVELFDDDGTPVTGTDDDFNCVVYDGG